MAFRVAARAVLELGAELISSDEIALYELVKNAFDAGSPDVEINFYIRLRRTEYEPILALLAEPIYIDDDTGELREPDAHEVKRAREEFQDARESIAERFSTLTDDEDLVDQMAHCRSRAALLELVQGAYDDLNYIVVRDTGEGMSERVLRDAFLTIGTPHRHEQRRKPASHQRSRPLLGEKGVGRLSAMRLGSKLEVSTGMVGAPHWNTLKIDWTLFGRNPSELVSDVPVILGPGGEKAPSKCGTTLTIRGLEADWTADKLRRIAAKELSRLSDPFISRNKTFPIKVSFNDERIKLERLSSELFKAAHGYCKGHFRLMAGAPVFAAEFEYRLYDERTSFKKELSELRDAITAQVPASALRTLGPFKFEFYWFNRQALRAIDEIGNATAVKNLVNSWSGGLMMFRNGFRVNPYGQPGDDWLELNRQAFKSSGYLLNTDQIIGRVQISTEGNPKLVDQTNREGLRDNFEYQALKNILHHFITVDLKKYIDRINDEYAGLKGLDFKQVDRNVEASEKRVERNLKELLKLFPGQKETLSEIKERFQAMRRAYDQARKTVSRWEEQNQRLMDLAGMGLMVEVVAHELARATKHTLDLVQSAQQQAPPPNLARTFSNLQAQLVTIERRLRVLDPLSISGRQRQTTFNLAEALQDVFEARAEELHSEGINWKIEGASNVTIRAVKGMIFQIIENLLSNSIHWLRRAREEEPNLRTRITVRVSTAEGGSFLFTDNGPGIAAAASEKVFDAFFTTRGEAGKGLGLYIARAAARHHGGDLTLVNISEIHPNRFNTFKFSMVASGDD